MHAADMCVWMSGRAFGPSCSLRYLYFVLVGVSSASRPLLTLLLILPLLRASSLPPSKAAVVDAREGSRFNFWSCVVPARHSSF